MKYLRKFNTETEYNSFLESDEYVVPNVCQIGQSTIVFNPLPKPFYIEALEALTVSLSVNNIQYSINNNEWFDLPANTPTPTIQAGKRVYFKGTTIPMEKEGIGTFTITGKCNLGGLLCSLIFGDNISGDLPEYAFYNLFREQANILSAGDLILPDRVSYYCFYGMFYNCSSLAIAPKLPATVLAGYCYGYMFRATALTKAPDLPALELVNNCYMNMFYNCASLSYIKAMFTTSPSLSYTKNWVTNVASNGTFVRNAAATWDLTGTSGIPSGWTVETATEQ